ncbi:hypothetical protein ACVIWU_005824 [Bradyrhizobium sp. USDA 4509]
MKKGRCAVYATAYTAHEVVPYFASELSRVENMAHHCLGKPELLGNWHDRRNTQNYLVSKHMHFTVEAPRIGKFGAFDRDLGIGMNFG